MRLIILAVYEQVSDDTIRKARLEDNINRVKGRRKTPVKDRVGLFSA